MNWYCRVFRTCSLPPGGKILAVLSLSVLTFLPACSVNQQVRAPDQEAMILAAEKKAPEDGRRILETGRDMALRKREILPGSCWDWINAVFNRAGFPAKNRKTLFKTAKKGPYADPKLILPGDWLYYVNHSYGNIEHSGIFVDWVSRGSKEALILSYGGEQRKEPGRYRPYDLSSVYTILRPVSR